MTLNRLPGSNPEIQKAAICSYWVSRLGLGFHPDTRGADYVDANLDRCLTDEEATDYEEDINRLFDLTGDPYEHALSAMRTAGLLP